jgi:carbon-monoxide dehydrogenase large subunit
MRCDPAELRERNLIPDDAYPYTSPTGMCFEALSHQKALSKLLEAMDYPRIRKEQAALREQGVYRGIGLSVFMASAVHASELKKGA